MFSIFKAKPRAGRVGLEVRADGLAMALAKPTKSKGGMRIVKSIFQTCSAAERAGVLQSLIEEHDLARYPCNFVLSADKYKTFPVEKPKVDDEELADAARWRLKDLLDYDLEHAVTDVYDFPEDGLRGRPQQVNVVACRKTIIQDVVNLVSETELFLESIDVADLALKNIVNVVQEDEEGAQALLYLRNGQGMLVFVKAGMLYLSRHFDFSLQALNEPSQQDSVLQHLALDIQRSSDYFESQMGQVPPRSIRLLGPDPNIPLANMLGGAIAAQVQPVDLSLICDLEGAPGLEHIHSFVAMGAALKRVEK